MSYDAWKTRSPDDGLELECSLCRVSGEELSWDKDLKRWICEWCIRGDDRERYEYETGVKP